MSESAILNITEIVENDIAAFLRVNQAISELEQSSNIETVVDVAAVTEVFKPEKEFTQSYLRRFENATSDILLYLQRTKLVTPLTVTVRRVFVLHNASPTFNINVTVTDDAGATQYVGSDLITVGPNEIVMIAHNGEKVVKLFGGQQTSGASEVRLTRYGLIPSNTEILRQIITTPITFIGGLATSVGTVGTNPSSLVSTDIQKNGVTVGSMDISTAGVFTFGLIGDVSFAAGDILTFVETTNNSIVHADLDVALKGIL